MFSARVTVLYTSDQYDYGQHYYRIGQQTSMTFQVQACNDAHVVMFDHYLGIAAYEIVIGGHGNLLSFLRNARFSSNVVTVSCQSHLFVHLIMLLRRISFGLFH